MTRFYRLADNDEDLPDDGLLAVTMQEPYEKPRIRFVPATEQEIHNAAMAVHAAEQDHALGDTR